MLYAIMLKVLLAVPLPVLVFLQQLPPQLLQHRCIASTAPNPRDSRGKKNIRPIYSSISSSVSIDAIYINLHRTWLLFFPLTGWYCCSGLLHSHCHSDSLAGIVALVCCTLTVALIPLLVLSTALLRWNNSGLGSVL